MNDISEVVRLDEERDASEKRWWSEKIELLLEKTDNKIEKGNEEIEKNSRKNDQHDWRKHLNEDCFQERKDRTSDVLDARGQRAPETATQQRNEINNMNQRRSRNEENAEDERSESNCVNTQIRHDEYVVCTKKYRRSQKI